MTNVTVGVDVSKDHLDAHRLPDGARRFAEAIGTLAKTDAVDAAMLARMGKALELPPIPLQSKNIIQLKELMIARRALVRDLTAARNRQKLATLPLVARMINRRITQIQADIATIETDIAKRIAQDAELAKRASILISIPGVGERTAAMLLIEMPELGAMDTKQAASLAGLAPMTQAPDTGKAKTTSVAEERDCAAPSICQLWLPPGSTQISKHSTPA